MDKRIDYPATQRNKDVILPILRRVFPSEGLVLEVASGTGQHGVYFAEQLGLSWQPTDLNPEHRDSVDAWAEHLGATHVRPALPLDVLEETWPVAHADAVFCANMIHIAPAACTGGLMRGVGRVLSAGAPFVLYGPFLEEDVPTAPSNLRFDASLRERDPSWGIRWRHEVEALAEKHGLHLEERIAMPANNLTLVFRRG